MSIVRKCIGWAVVLAITATIQSSRAQSPQRKGGTEQELVRTEMGFFEAWKTKDQAYFRNHIPENGVFWGEYGTFSRAAAGGAADCGQDMLGRWL